MDTLSVQEAADLLHISVKRVQAMAREGRLPAVRVGRRWLFHRSALERLLGSFGAPAEEFLSGLSARNRLRGRVTGLVVDGLMAEVRVDVGGQELVAMITRAAAERLGLAVGAQVCAVIKSTEVMIGREGRP